MIYNVTFGFEGMGQGWSETHALKSSSEDPETVMLIAVAIAEKRVTFLGREFTINAIRVSAYSNDGATERVKGVALNEQGFSNPVQTAIASAEPANVALKIFGTTNNTKAPPLYKSNKNITYAGAPPDKAVTNGGIVDEGEAGLGAAFAQWRSLMLANCGWLLNTRIADREISAITPLANGKVEIEIIGTLVPTLTDNLIYPIRVRAVNGGRSPMNGALNARFLTPNKLITQEIIGIALAQEGGSVAVYSRIKPYAGFVDMKIARKVAKHQRGRPFGSTPGRAPNRVRG